MQTQSQQREENGVVTPYAGMVYEVNRAWSVYGSYTSIFKPQDYRDATGAYLAPVEGKSYEAGIKGELLQRRLNVSAAVFRIEQDNFAQQVLPQVFVPGFPNEFAYRGVKGSTSQGVEFDMNGEVRPDWQASLGVSYSRAKDASGAAINSAVPRTQAKLFTSYKLDGDWDKLTVGGGATWQSKASDVIGPNNETFVQDACGVVSVFGRYQFDKRLSCHSISTTCSTRPIC